MLLAFLFAVFLSSSISSASVAFGSQFLKKFRRAGGPAFDRLLSGCSVTNPLACTGSPCTRVQTTQNVQVINSTIQSAQIYAYYLPQNDEPVTDWNPQWLFQRCLSACYGYGSAGECVAVYQAYNFPAPAMEGSAGGSISVACLMFNRPLSLNDFQLVNNSAMYTNVSAGDINCGVGAAAASQAYPFSLNFQAARMPVSWPLSRLRPQQFPVRAPAHLFRPQVPHCQLKLAMPAVRSSQMQALAMEWRLLPSLLGL